MHRGQEAGRVRRARSHQLGDLRLRLRVEEEVGVWVGAREEAQEVAKGVGCEGGLRREEGVARVA